MSEMSFEQMLDESFKTIHNGEVVEGTVIDVKDDEDVYKRQSLVWLPSLSVPQAVFFSERLCAS